MSTQPTVQVVHVPQTGRQSTSHVLEVPGTEGTSMQVLSVDPVSTTLDGGALQFPVGDSRDDGITETTPGQQAETGGRWDSNLSASDHDQGGNQRPCPESTVQGLQQTSGGSQENAGGDACGQEGGLQRRSDSGDDREGQGRLRGVQEVPSVAEDARGLRKSDEARIIRNSEEEELEEIRKLMLERPRAQKRMERVVRQASTALGCAEAMWHEVMNLLTVPAPGLWNRPGGDNWSKASVSNSKPGEIPYSRSSQTYQNLLGLDAKQMKTVAEIYNPNRFYKPETKRQGLIHGSAFDLELGHDLLIPDVQEEVSEYLQHVKPGLVVISPICTLWSSMQNMNRKHLVEPEKMRVYNRRLREAKVLLRFGVRMAKVVQAYGGVFLIEQPLTSKAWQCDELYQLLQEADVHLARCDQCMYGLKDLQGTPQMKPTGWCSNSEVLLQHLDRRCESTTRSFPRFWEASRDNRNPEELKFIRRR